jgi:hypothetical protein
LAFFAVIRKPLELPVAQTAEERNAPEPIDRRRHQTIVTQGAAGLKKLLWPLVQPSGLRLLIAPDDARVGWRAYTKCSK